MPGRATDLAEAILDRLRPLPDRLRLGRAGERAARAHLRRHGYRLLAANVRVPMGEADILCRCPDTDRVVLVEVKTRRTPPVPAPLWTPEHNLTPAKRRRLRAILAYLCRRNAWDPAHVRIDAIALELDPHNRVTTLRHHRNIA